MDDPKGFNFKYGGFEIAIGTAVLVALISAVSPIVIMILRHYGF